MEKSKLTAYALNEVSEAERAEIEQYLNSHPLEKAEVEEIKLVSSILKSEMASELVVTPPPLPQKKVSFWASLLRPRVLATGFSLVFVGFVSAVLISREMHKMTSLTESAMSPHEITGGLTYKQNQELLAQESERKTVSRDDAGPAKKFAPQASADSAGSVGPSEGEMPATAVIAQEDSSAHAESALGIKDKSKVGMYNAFGEARAKMDEMSTIETKGAGSGAALGSAKARSGNIAANSEVMKRKTIVEPGRMPMPSTPAPETADSTAGEEYKQSAENEFIQVSKEALSTFSIDVDTASYSNARRYLTNYTQIPPIDSIRTEEFVNYFDYDYKAPTSGHPIAVHMEATKSPWNDKRAIVRIGLKGKEIEVKDRPKSNLVFLIDVSGSMEDENKLPLVKSALKTLTEQLNEKDRISMVVYAGSSGVVLESTPGDKKDKILSAIQKLSAGGGTNGEGGIRKAYEIAMKNYVSGGNNRVILASDGDFNVGVTSPTELLNIIKEKSEGGVFLTVLGFGMGNYKDARLEEISNKGQGNYFYIDNSKEANKVFVNQLSGTLYTIAKDVKVQVEFNPKVVHSYRLVGYENRMLNKEDFTNDKVDAGEMGAGHSVTALYEIEWKGNAPSDIKLKYQPEEKVKEAAGSTDEILTAKVRYKKPTNSTSEFFEQALPNKVVSLSDSSCSTRFAVAVASFSQWMRKSAQLKDFDSKRILEISEGCLATKDKKDSFKEEFIDLVKKAREIRK